MLDVSHLQGLWRLDSRVEHEVTVTLFLVKLLINFISSSVSILVFPDPNKVINNNLNIASESRRNLMLDQEIKWSPDVWKP